MQHLALPGAHLLKPPCTIFRTILSHKFAYTEINTLYHPMMQLQAGRASVLMPRKPNMRRMAASMKRIMRG